MAAQGSVDLSLLLQHDALLRRLAVRLAGAADGEDAVQDTWLAALRQGGLRAGTAKAWLAVALKRFIAGGRRAGARAKRREAAVARRDVAPSAAEIVEREAARREVVSALLALDPIYRDALLLRYESDLPPRKIAAALGIPVETARTRIKRGLAMMRQHLDDEVGPDRRKALVFLLVPADAPAAGLAALGLLAACLLATVVIVAAHGAPPPAAGAPAREPAAGDASVAKAGLVRRAIRPRSSPPDPAALIVLDEREVSDSYPCAEPREANGAHRFVATRVVDELTGAPVAGARVCLVDEAAGPEPLEVLARGASDSDGWVRLAVEPHGDRRLGVFWSADGFAAGAASGPVPPFPIRLQRAGARTVRVVDAAATPIAGATLRWGVGSPRFAASSVAMTGSDGLARVDGIDPSSGFLVASHAGHATAELALAAEEPGAPPSEIVLLPAGRATNDDLEAAAEAVARPVVLVEIAHDRSPAARVRLLTEDAACDVTGEVLAGERVPVPLRGPARVVLVDGADREAHRLPEPRVPGSALIVRFDSAPSSRRAAAVELFAVGVRDGLDAPVAGARVVVEGRSGLLAGTTDARGQAVFEASAVKPGGAIAVRAPGFALVFSRVESMDAASLAWPSTALEVVVKGPDSAGLPPPVVIVDGEPAFLDRGSVSVAGLAPGEHVAVVAATGWIPKVVRFELTGAADAVLEVVLRPQPR